MSVSPVEAVWLGCLVYRYIRGIFYYGRMELIGLCKILKIQMESNLKF